MLNIFFKTVFRNLRKSKIYNGLNIFGLAIGIACASLIFLWVQDELTFNHNFGNSDYLYRVMENQLNDGKINTAKYTPAPMAAAIKTDLPGIKNAASVSWEIQQNFKLGDKQIMAVGIYADPDILSMFDMPFIFGKPTNALKDPYSIVISETMAKNFFGNENPVGKMLKADSKQNFSEDGNFLVTGVFKDLPGNCTYSFQWISPYKLHLNKFGVGDRWDISGTETLVELRPNADPTEINKKLENYLSTKSEGSSIRCFLFAMNNWNLYDQFTDGKQDGGKIKYVKLFSLIAVMILFIACVNFMNLATARSQQRAKEVGVRKVLGSGRIKLIRQFMGESLLMSFISVLVAVCILYLALPSFNLLVQKNLSLLSNPSLYFCGLITIGLFCGVIAGIYPAFYLSSFNPVIVLKGLKIKTGTAPIFIRKGLVIAQFTVSIILIISTVIIYQQVRYVKNRDLGFKKDNLIWMLLQGNLKTQFASVRNDLLNSGLVENVALSGAEPLHLYHKIDNISWQGKDPNSKITILMDVVSPEYIPTMGMKLKDGRNFYNTPDVDSTSIIINESFAKLMGDAGKTGSMITFYDSTRLTVVGIIKNFVFNDMYGPGMPMMLHCDPRSAGVLLIALKPDVAPVMVLPKIEKIIKAYNPGSPFDYSFVDDEFNKLFTLETLMENLAGIFAVLAILISCLGLLGLAAYTAQQRTKEIGIRKVLGASVSDMAVLLSKDFFRLVIISCVIAFPVAWWVMNNWLQEYQYRTAIQWWIFPFAGFIALGIAVFTVSSQAIKAAMVNPVLSLRSE